MLGRARMTFVVISLAVLIVCLGFSWSTRDAMENLPFLKGHGTAVKTADSQKTLVDLRPWQTASTLATLAVTNEEAQYAEEAERLADHEVDQAFAAALREASARVQKRALTGEALELSQRVGELEQLVKDDKAQVASLTASGAGSGDHSGDSDDLEIAKAQLGLDNDQLNDAQEDLARASGDDRSQIQQELSDREATMKKYDSDGHVKGQAAVASAKGYATLAARIGAWRSQITRHSLLEQAQQLALSDVASLTKEHNTLEVQVNTAAQAASGPDATGQVADHAAKLANLRERSAERQLLSIYDDRIQTEQQLATVYGKWAAQVLLQHRIVFHLILQSVALIAFILICVVLVDAVLMRLMERPTLDGRRTQTLRKILQLAVQVMGGLMVLLVVFGSPRQMPTIIGLATAGLTVVLQDFIIAFFGWFVLMGKHGIRVGDWVEINGVGGEVTEIGLFRTTLLETGNWTDKGHPTGRRVTFINSFAIRGQYFNFSTTGQWMWDEISLSVPASDDTYAMVEDIHKAVIQETEKDARVAEQEWKRGSRSDGLSQFSADATVNLRPSAAGVDVLVRYVTRAAERFEMRNRLFQRVLDVLRRPSGETDTAPANPS
jgi:small-conductance mechanosensitive channel